MITFESEPTKTESKETVPQVENTIVDINIIRHSKKEKGEVDARVHLTPEGKLLALCEALQKGEIEGVLAKGSLRDRTQETAGIFALAREILSELNTSPENLNSLRTKLGQKEQITQTEKDLLKRVVEKCSLENLEKRYNVKFDTENIKWIEGDDRLDFRAQGLVEKNQNEAFVAGRLLEYQIQRSDQEALESQDLESSTYSRTAAAIADLVLSYVATGGDLHKTVKEMVRLNPSAFRNVLKEGKCTFERMFGTHAAIGESFMLKLVGILERSGELPEGTQSKIIEKTGASFQETEGIKVEVDNYDGGQTLKLILPERVMSEGLREIRFSADVLEKIIAEGKALDKQITEIVEESKMKI